MTSILHRPIAVIAVYLSLLYILALYFTRSSLVPEQELIRLVGLGLGWFLPFLVIKLVFKIDSRLDNLLVSFLILLLIASRNANIAQIFFLGLSSSSIKILLREKTGPIFNPAAAGLFLSSLFVKLSPTWWGVSFSPRLDFFSMSLANLLTIPVGLFIIFKYQKLPSLISIPAVFGLVYYVFTRTFPFFILLEGTFLFFLFIMATEPKTTPLLDSQEYVYGIVLGSFLALTFVFHLTGMPYIASLLIVNFFFALYKLISFKLAKSPSL